jgi:hypothetical protein
VRKIPLALSRGLGSLASRRRWLAVVFIVTVFYGIPLLLLFTLGRS